MIGEKTGKIPVYVNSQDNLMRLSKKWGRHLLPYYNMSYADAASMLERYFTNNYHFTTCGHSPSESSVRISLYLENAKFDNLHMFVIDFDKIDGTVETGTAFFQSAKALADKVTRSQGGGYHMFYGVDKEKATPLFDSINLLTAKGTKSYVSKTREFTLDRKNKVDMFCDALHFIYEWEAWDNTVGLTDKTQQLYELIGENFTLKRPMDFAEWEDADDGSIILEGLPEELLKQEMNDRQRTVFEDLKTISSDYCGARAWFRTGLDIYHAFGDELGGSVFLWWSKPGHSFNPQGCARTWSNICRKGPNSQLFNFTWRLMLMNSF